MKTKINAALAFAAMALATTANAAIDISAETTAAKADIAENGALVISVVVAIAVVGWIRRIIR